MRRSRAALAATAALTLAFAGGAVTASALTPNDKACRAGITLPYDLGEAVAYNACRANLQDAALQRIENKLGTTPASPSPSPTATSSPTVTASPTPSSTPTTASPSPTATATASPTVTPAGVCDPAKALFKFAGNGSRGMGSYGYPGFDASAEWWNTNGYNYGQDMGVCSVDSWYVNVKADNSTGDGAVKAYPSMRRIYHDWSTTDFSKDPRLSTFPQLKVDFASTDPTDCTGCIYNTAFDVWLNGIGGSNNTELMIWTHNVNQRPYGSKVASGVEISGHTWDLWSGNNNHYIAYVPTDTGYIKSGTVDLNAFIGDLKTRGRIADSALGQAGKDDPYVSQISWGVEAVSTGGVYRGWNFTKFGVIDK